MISSGAISVVIPAYNSADFLPEAVASVRRQSVPVHEIIIVDDGSTDRSAEVIAGLGTDIVYLRQDNAGPSAARNRGIAQASGELIAFLDADDIWVPDKLERQLAVLSATPTLALVAGDMAEVDREGNTMTGSVLRKHRLLDGLRALNGAPIPDAVARLAQKNFIPTGTVLVKRTALDTSGYFDRDIRYGEDQELWCRIASDHPIACLGEVLMLRRQHGDNATQQSEKLLSDLVRVMERIRDYCAGPLREQGVDPDRLVANAWTNLGYWYFDTGRLGDARRALRAGLKERITGRGLAYAVACLLPRQPLYLLRSVKQRFSNS